MQDDVYLIAAEGWIDAAKPRGVIDDKEKKIKETPDLIVKRKKYKMDLIPPPLIVARYFVDEQAEIARLESEVTAVIETREEFEEEHAGDEDALNGLEGQKGITKGNVQERAMALKQVILDAYDKNTREYEQAKAIKKTTFGTADWTAGTEDEDGLFQELDVLFEYLQFVNRETAQKKALKEAQTKLDDSVLRKYSKFGEDEIKSLAVADKWFASIGESITSEVNHTSQRLADRVAKLEQRYADTMPKLVGSIESLSSRVEGHLKEMGLVWT